MSSSTQTTAPPESTAIPNPVRAVLELFEGPLAGVAFPDVDADALSGVAARVDARRTELQRALAAVQDARTALEAEQATLLSMAQRAHAYAIVFAGGNTELSAKLADIKLEGRPAAPRKQRGRPRKEQGKDQGKKSQTSLSVADSDAA